MVESCTDYQQNREICTLTTSESLGLEVFIVLDGEEAARFHKINEVATGKGG